MNMGGWLTTTKENPQALDCRKEGEVPGLGNSHKLLTSLVPKSDPF